jgi:hypothetical protein
LSRSDLQENIADKSAKDTMKIGDPGTLSERFTQSEHPIIKMSTQQEALDGRNITVPRKQSHTDKGHLRKRILPCVSEICRQTKQS